VTIAKIALFNRSGFLGDEMEVSPYPFSRIASAIIELGIIVYLEDLPPGVSQESHKPPAGCGGEGLVFFKSSRSYDPFVEKTSEDGSCTMSVKEDSNETREAVLDFHKHICIQQGHGRRTCTFVLFLTGACRFYALRMFGRLGVHRV
jgi:hypothetical protein